MLVAVSITAALAGFIVAIVSNVSGFWSRTTGRISAEAQARYVLDQLTLDLQGAIFRDDGSVALAADVIVAATGNNSTMWQQAGNRANDKPPSGVSLDLPATRADLAVKGRFSDTRYGNAGVWLRLFTTRRGANVTSNSLATASVPVAVGYQIFRRFSAATANSVAATKTAYFLHRVEVRPAATTGGTPRPGVLESGYNLTASAYTTGTANNTGNTTGDPVTIQVVSTNPRNLDSVIAENVIDFGIRAYVRDATQPSGLRLIFPATTAGVLTNSSKPLRAQLPSDTPPTSPNYDPSLLMPDVVDVMVRILTDEGARMIATYEQANSPLTLPQGRNAQQYWWDLADANSQTFTRRIALNAKSL